MKRSNCSACGYDDLQVFLDLGMSPIADAYTDTATEHSARHPLQLAVCTGCWLVQLLEVVDQKTLFGTGYSFYSSASAPLSDYHARYADWILSSRFADCARGLVVEVGCNDGDMLRHFRKLSSQPLGVDPASGPVGVARERGLEVIEEPFTLACATRIVDSHGTAGVVIANHVLAHVEDVSEVLHGVSYLLSGSGVAFVEVQYLPDLLVSNAYDLVYHEHRNFFSLTSLKRAALRWGLHVVDAQLTDRQGGSLRVTLQHVRHQASKKVQGIENSESWLHHENAYHGFQGRVERIRERLLQLISDECADGRRIIGYGAPAKATTLLNFCDLDSATIDYVIDTTSAKQERYIPGTGLKILKPRKLSSFEFRRTTYLLLAWNYLRHIVRMESDFIMRGGHWLTPIPVPNILGD